ncbi:MAG: hypothetical protein JO132_01860 [Streptosporangiaceae bacterium]|nr:hypothetical protein [Streptosporangiaceae bacterium]
MQHLPAVDQRVFWLQQVGETVELLEPRIGVMLAVRGVTGNLNRDDVLGHVLAVVCAERDPGYPGGNEGASFLVLAPAREFPLGEQALVLGGLLGADMDDDDIEFAHDAIMNQPAARRRVCPVGR